MVSSLSSSSARLAAHRDANHFERQFTGSSNGLAMEPFAVHEQVILSNLYLRSVFCFSHFALFPPSLPPLIPLPEDSAWEISVVHQLLKHYELWDDKELIFWVDLDGKPFKLISDLDLCNMVFTALKIQKMMRARETVVKGSDDEQVQYTLLYHSRAQTPVQELQRPWSARCFFESSNKMVICAPLVWVALRAQRSRTAAAASRSPAYGPAVGSCWGPKRKRRKRSTTKRRRRRRWVLAQVQGP